MNTSKAKYLTALFVLLLVASGLSFGYLVGQSHRANAARETASEPVQMISEQLTTGANVVNKSVRFLQEVLVK